MSSPLELELIEHDSCQGYIARIKEESLPPHQRKQFFESLHLKPLDTFYVLGTVNVPGDRILRLTPTGINANGECKYDLERSILSIKFAML